MTLTQRLLKKNGYSNDGSARELFNSIEIPGMEVSNYDKLADVYFHNSDIKDRMYRKEVLGDFKNFRKLRWMEENWEPGTIGCISKSDAFVIGFDSYLEEYRKYHFNIGEVLYFNSITLHSYLKTRNCRSKINWRENEKGHREFSLSRFGRGVRDYESIQYNGDDTRENNYNEEIAECSNEAIGETVDFDRWCYGVDSDPCIGSVEFWESQRMN